MKLLVVQWCSVPVSVACSGPSSSQIPTVNKIEGPQWFVVPFVLARCRTMLDVKTDKHLVFPHVVLLGTRSDPTRRTFPAVGMSVLRTYGTDFDKTWNTKFCRSKLALVSDWSNIIPGLQGTQSNVIEFLDTGCHKTIECVV